ncbi:MAG: NAD(P)-dependent oxidoreductase [Anaerolineales bacterium]|nr:NAD(P)-dependent oxidoreductase [Anaerolineales bacterium]
MQLRQELLRRQAENKPIRVGASGAGWMGSGFVAAMKHVPGMEVVLLADADTKAAWNAFLSTGLSREDIIEADTVSRAMDALQAGRRVVTGDYRLAAQVEAVDIVADVTYSPAIGAETAYTCIQHGKDVVLVNIEADVTVGRILKKLAQEAGVLYTVSSGDEPGCLMELYNFVTCLGYEIMVIGKGKNNPLNPAATPETVAESARRQDKDPYQVASYVDGTKTMFEMTCAANATGCLPMQRGMIGPEATLETVSQAFALAEDGGLTRFPGAVDFVQGSSMAGGVFVTVRIDDARIQADLNYLKVGTGKYFTFFRPYHLWFLEAPISIAQAHLLRQPTLAPLDRPIADIMTVAKRNLQPGETLDDFGGFTVHGVMDRAEVIRELKALPVGLAPGAQVARPVAAGAVITWDDVKLDEASTVVKLRRQQDELA